MNDRARYLELFRLEAEELLGGLERELLRLDEDAGARGAVEGALRALHTLKGMATTLELEAFAALAHALEDALQPLRAGRRRPGCLALGLEGIDALRSGLGAETAASFERRALALVARLGPECGVPPVAAVEELPPGFGGREAPPAAADEPASDGPNGPPRRETGSLSSDTLRISRRLLDRLLNETGELVVLTERLQVLAKAAGARDLREPARRAAGLAADLQRQVLAARMVPLDQVFERFPRSLREHARRTGKAVRLVMAGGEIEMDRAVLDGVGEPLLHLLRNAVDHGIETPAERLVAGKPEVATVSLTAWRAAPGVLLEVSDDGRGLDRARLREAARGLGIVTAERLTAMADEEVDRLAVVSGLSTAGAVSETSGRGVGLDVVQAAVTRLGGSLTIRSSEGRGAAFTLHLPLTLALVRALVVEEGGLRYAIPLASLAETRPTDPAGAGEPSPPALSRLLGDVGEPAPGPVARAGTASSPRPRRVVVLDAGGERLSVRVDAVLGTREVVVRSLLPLRGARLAFQGVVLLGDGSLALLVDAARVIDGARAAASTPAPAGVAS